MRDSGWYPHRSKRGHDPEAGTGKNGHHSLRGINELITIVEMQWDDMPCRVVMRVRSNVGSLVAKAVEDRSLSLLRHNLSQ
jgi:hypothetical protein